MQKKDGSIRVRGGNYVTGRKRQIKLRSSRVMDSTKKNQQASSKSSGRSSEQKISTLSLKDIKKILDSSSKKQSKELFRISSKNLRKELCDKAADAIAAREVASLSKFGGRKWKCDVTLTEKEKKGQLFRWYCGEIELASLPHILEKIPISDDLEKEMEDNILKTNLLTEMARNNERESVINRVWRSPDHLECFKVRKNVQERCEKLNCSNNEIERIVYGYGTNNKLLSPFRVTKYQALETGLLRFLRDGLWVVGQEENWQVKRWMLRNKKKKTPLQYFISQKRQGLRKKRSLFDKKCTLAEVDKELKVAFKILPEEERNKWKEKAENEMRQVKSEDLEKKLNDCPFSKHSAHWRLSKEHQTLCYDECMDHYQTVLNTVKARSLFDELQIGFDVLRERGYGRYDMELPAFDEPKFSFLTSKTAPWMPVIKKILGDEAYLIHKGCFLSFPGSQVQVYHQDGLHLHKTKHRPCHAVNVFIPLVDLTSKNGPTEFCLGTHILGNENYNKERIEIPLAKAGTPVIFDYRLGHRGLGNLSDQPRPILYLTYTVEKSFKDVFNFSSKRYQKIGYLVPMPISREERAQQREVKRQKQLE